MVNNIDNNNQDIKWIFMITIIFKRIHQYSRMKANKFKFYDIAANLTDNQFSG